jgi:hypothetical protein
MEYNKWETDNDTEYEDEEYITNEVPPPGLNQEFVDNIFKVKHDLYNDTVLAPELGTPQAQNVGLVQNYLNNINYVYILSLSAQKGIVDESQLNKFPVGSRESIKFILHWIKDYFSKNRIPDTIPYEDYVRKSFREYQFIQNNNSFE